MLSFQEHKMNIHYHEYRQSNYGMSMEKKTSLVLSLYWMLGASLVSLFSRTQKVNDPCGQHIYIQEQCSTFDIDKDK